MATDLAQIIPRLVHGEVDFILIGGMAAVLHGAARVTFDADIVYDRRKQNLTRLADTLKPLGPSLRDAPPGLPFKLDVTTLGHGLNFTLTTTLGDLDLFGEVIGGGDYKALLPHSLEVDAFGVRFKCIDLPTLIRIKEAAGRAKDRESLAELRVLFEEQKSKSQRKEGN